MTLNAKKRKIEDLWNAFFAQRLSLVTSMANYDMGNKFEAARIANAVFILVGRGMRHHTSILDQIGLQNAIPFVASNGGHTDGSPLACAHLYMVKENNWLIESAPMADGNFTPKNMPFEEWWNQRVLNSDDFELSRADLVRIVRDKDGGSHFDGEVDDPKCQAVLDGKIGLLYQSDGGPKSIVPWGVQSMVWKVGEELRDSIRFLEIQHDAPIREYTFLEGSRFQP